MHTAEPLLHEFNPFEVEFAIEKFKSYKSRYLSNSGRVDPKRVSTLRSMVHELNIIII